jgi:hypothetical protein
MIARYLWQQRTQVLYKLSEADQFGTRPRRRQTDEIRISDVSREKRHGIPEIVWSLVTTNGMSFFGSSHLQEQHKKTF